MNAFPLRITSPEGDLFCADALKISLRGTEGDLAVMAGHVPFVTAVRPCDCKVETEDGVRFAHTDGGLLTVMRDRTIFLAGSFVWKDGE